MIVTRLLNLINIHYEDRNIIIILNVPKIVINTRELLFNLF